MAVWDLDRELYLIAGEKALRGLDFDHVFLAPRRFGRDRAYALSALMPPSKEDDSEIVRRAMIWRKLRARKEEGNHGHANSNV